MHLPSTAVRRDQRTIIDTFDVPLFTLNPQIHLTEADRIFDHPIRGNAGPSVLVEQSLRKRDFNPTRLVSEKVT
jgi:hypothetical protein